MPWQGLFHLTPTDFMFPWHQYLLGFAFVFAGFMHFQKPEFYLRIIPKYLPYPKNLVFVSGMAEMLLGLMLLNAKTQQLAAWSIMLLLVLFLTVHTDMIKNPPQWFRWPKGLLTLRLLLQGALIYWAFLYV